MYARIRLWFLCDLPELKEKALLWIVWRLPRKIVYWAGIRMIAHATQGQYSNQAVPELRAMEAVERWRVTSKG